MKSQKSKLLSTDQEPCPKCSKLAIYFRYLSDESTGLSISCPYCDYWSVTTHPIVQKED